MVLQDNWEFQEITPVRESHYSYSSPPAGSSSRHF